MKMNEIKEQLQEDILSILEGYDIKDYMEGFEYDRMTTALCNSVINNLNKLENE